MKHRPLVFIDVETTGASAHNSRVLEIGALRVENNIIVKKYTQLINPESSVPAFISNLTGIYDKDVWNMPTFKDIASDIEDMLDSAIFVAHNVSFDYGFIKTEFQRLGISLNQDRLCTVRLSRTLYPAQKSHRLDEVIKTHGYQVANRHRAFDDAEVLHRFYQDHVDLHGPALYQIMDKLLIKTSLRGV